MRALPLNSMVVPPLGLGASATAAQSSFSNVNTSSVTSPREQAVMTSLAAVTAAAVYRGAQDINSTTTTAAAPLPNPSTSTTTCPISAVRPRSASLDVLVSAASKVQPHPMTFGAGPRHP